MDQWYLDNLVCPVTKHELIYKDNYLVSPNGRKYPVVDGMPVMLVDDVTQTMPLINASIERSKNNKSIIDERAKNLYLESLGISEEQKNGVVELSQSGNSSIDPVVSYIVGATSGYAYQELVGKLEFYPIPDIRLDKGNGKKLLDIGCNWGRWSISASNRGYKVVGLDPSLGAVMAARRVANQLGLEINYVVADSRFLPFRGNYFDNVYSYSVLQHLSKEDVGKSLHEIRRILKTGGKSLIQMPNFLGIRCLQHQFRRRFREAQRFEVRYWSISELQNIFNNNVGISTISVDCYFGLGLQKSDMKYMPIKLKCIISLSEVLRRMSLYILPMKYIADSVYIESNKIE